MASESELDDAAFEADSQMDLSAAVLRMLFRAKLEEERSDSDNESSVNVEGAAASVQRTRATTTSSGISSYADGRLAL